MSAAAAKLLALKARLLELHGAREGLVFESLSQDLDDLVATVERQAREPVAPPAEHGPEMPLSETLKEIEEWTGNADPTPPANVIEVMCSAAWWLRLLLRMREQSPISRWLRMGPGHGMHSKVLERRERGDAEGPIGVVLMDDNGIVELGEGATHEEAEGVALDRLMTRKVEGADPE